MGTIIIKWQRETYILFQLARFDIKRDIHILASHSQ
jgi:hypothetical protein